MTIVRQIQKLTDEALVILSALGVPLTGLTERRLEKMAKAFLAVAGMKPGLDWSQAKDSAPDGGHQLQSRVARSESASARRWVGALRRDRPHGAPAPRLQ